VLAIVAAVTTASALFAWFGAEPIRARSVATLLVVVAVSLIAFTAFQCVPMPVTLLAKIAPANADVWSRALLPLHEAGPRLAPITLDPMATRVQVLRGATYLATFLAAFRIANRREGVVFLERAVLASSVIVAISALLHPAFGAERVFGAYRPQIDFGHRIGPLLNANHLAAYVNIGIAMGLGMTLSAKPHAPRAASAIMVVLLVAVECWIGSRGGVGTMIMSLALGVAMAFAARRGEATARLSTIALGLALLSAVAIFIFAGIDESWREVADTDFSKLSLAKDALLDSRVFAVFGAGRGSFESVFPAFRTSGGYVTFTHPENLLAQWAFEWGVPISAAALLTILFALRPKTALARTHVPIGAWVALACVAVHNLVDFSSEMPGVVVSLTVCAALVVGGSGGGTKTQWFDRWAFHPNVVAGVVLVTTACALFFAVPTVGLDLHEDEVTMRALAFDHETTRDAFHAAERAALLRHPAEPYLAYAGSLRALRVHDESVVPWVERTLERAPIYGRAHLVLARALFATSPAQARLEYRLALDEEPNLGSQFANEAPRLVNNYDDAMELVSSNVNGLKMLEIIAEAIGPRLPATRDRIDAEILRRTPGAIEPSLRLAREALADLKPGGNAPWCDANRAACIDLALTRSAALEQRDPEHCAPFELHASVLLAAGRTDEAIDELETASAKVQDREACFHSLVSLALASNRPARVDATIDRISRLACAGTDECVNSFRYISDIEMQRGHRTTALGFLRKAHAIDPDREDITAAEAALAASLGLHTEAIEGYSALIRKHPENAEWQAALVTETAERSRSLLPHVNVLIETPDADEPR
jgi:hypothetical protein